MDDKKIQVTTQDRLMRAWQNSMELVTDYEDYSKAIKDDEVIAETFGRLAEEECVHAAQLRQMLHDYQNR